MARGRRWDLPSSCGTQSPLSRGEAGIIGAVYFVMFVLPDFLSMSGGFSAPGSHSSSQDFVSLQFPALNPFLPEIPRMVCLFELDLDRYTYIVPTSPSPRVFSMDPLFLTEPTVPQT